MHRITTFDLGVHKPNIPKKISKNWTKILDLLATIADVPVSIVMHALPTKTEVLSKSKIRDDENIYDLEILEYMKCTSCCEIVMKEKSELYVKNSLEYSDWRDNPSMATDMISYYGQPLLWSDNTVFGTICILDKKDLVITRSLREMVSLFRNTIENDLSILETSHKQKKLLKAEIYNKTQKIQEQNIELENLNRYLEERVKKDVAINEKQQYEILEQAKKARLKVEDLNVTLEHRVKEEVTKNNHQNKQMLQQSRLAQMGEMISMIAHQWRQPLTAISSRSNSVLIKIMIGEEIDKESLKKEMEHICEYSQHLSKTIDSFRGFFSESKAKQLITLEEIIEGVLDIVQASIENENIKIITNMNCNKKVETYPNEVKQVILNLIKNAEDILLELNIENPMITIQTMCDSHSNKQLLIIKDNAGGIPKNIIDKIFDPYFSTKLEKNGTGLGLYMSKTIIEDHCGGKLNVMNDEYGAVFKIEL